MNIKNENIYKIIGIIFTIFGFIISGYKAYYSLRETQKENYLTLDKRISIIEIKISDNDKLEQKRNKLNKKR